MYVNDMVVIGSDHREVLHVLDALSDEFRVHDLGNLNYFLGVRVWQSPASLFLDQQCYLADLLHNNKLYNLRPSTTPMEANLDLSID